MESLPLSAANTPVADGFLSEEAAAAAAESAKIAAQARSEERTEIRETTRYMKFSLVAQDATNESVCREREGEVALLSTGQERGLSRTRCTSPEGETMPR